MLNPTPRWLLFEKADEAATYGNLSPADALERFERLWLYARVLDPALGQDWETDLDADLAVARAINGLPPA